MRRAVTAGALATVLALASCGGGEQLRFAEGNIADAEGFLETVEQQWQAELADRDATVHDEARCYFARDDVNELLDEVVYCGPLRHSEQQPNDSTETAQPDEPQLARQGAWDTYRFTISDGDEGLHLTDARLDLLGTDLRVDRSLVRPDGLEPPANAEDFAKPEVPTVRSGFVTTTEDDPHIRDTAETADGGGIVTPITTITVDTVGTIDDVDDSSERKEAPAGETLRALTLSFARGPYANAYDDAAGSDTDVDYVDATVEYFVDIGGDRTPILEDGTPERPVSVIASVPDDGDAELVVSVDGIEQTVSFTTGERTSETAAAFYLEETETSLDAAYPASEQTNGDFEVSQSLRFDRAQLTPFHPEHGWAEDNHTWLVATTSQVSFIWNDTDYAVTLERTESATLTLPDGTEVADETSATEYDYFAFGDTLEFVFEVPDDDVEDGASVELDYTPVLTFASKGGSASPSSGEVRLDSLDFTIDLPAS